jgi:hypothetical protein
MKQSYIFKRSSLFFISIAVFTVVLGFGIYQTAAAAGSQSHDTAHSVGASAARWEAIAKFQLSQPVSSSKDITTLDIVDASSARWEAMAESLPQSGSSSKDITTYDIVLSLSRSLEIMAEFYLFH